jgi:hypothetical protein
LEALSELCPKNKQQQLRIAKSYLSDTSPFNKSLLALLPEATMAERCLLLHCFSEFDPSEKVTDVERSLCQNYNIDLRTL